MPMLRTLAAAALAGLLSTGAAQAAGGEAGVTPDAALRRLKEGNARFVKGRLKHPNGAPARRTAVAAHQSPFAVILSCSDSRVPPELVFDQGLGDLFVVRTAGQVVAELELGSIEYAVEHLGASLVLVLGHERCGAVKATVESLHPPPVKTVAQGAGQGHGAKAEHAPAGHEAAAHGAHGEHDEPAHGEHGEPAHGSHAEPAHGSHDEPAHGAHAEPAHGGHGAAAHGGHAKPAQREVDSPEEHPRDHIHHLVAAIQPAVKAVERRVAPGELLDAAVQENVRQLVARLVRDSPLLKSFLVAGRIRVAGARYDLDTGEVKILR